MLVFFLDTYRIEKKSNGCTNQWFWITEIKYSFKSSSCLKPLDPFGTEEKEENKSQSYK